MDKELIHKAHNVQYLNEIYLEVANNNTNHSQL